MPALDTVGFSMAPRSLLVYQYQYQWPPAPINFCRGLSSFLGSRNRWGTFNSLRGKAWNTKWPVPLSQLDSLFSVPALRPGTVSLISIQPVPLIASFVKLKRSGPFSRFLYSDDSGGRFWSMRDIGLHRRRRLCPGLSALYIPSNRLGASKFDCLMWNLKILGS